MVRRYYRRRPANRDKYSVETTVINPPSDENAWTVVPGNDTLITSKQFAIAVLPPSDIQGMRKVKHFTLTFSNQNNDDILFYALVYVPAGYDNNPINVPQLGTAVSLYEPNQYVLSSGVLDFSGGPLRIRCPLARNLNSGDSVFLVLATTMGPPPVRATVQYAITLQ